MIFTYFIMILVTILGALMYLGRRKCKSFFLQHSQKHILGSRHYHDRRIRRYNAYHILRSDNFSHRHVTRILDTGRSYPVLFLQN